MAAVLGRRYTTEEVLAGAELVEAEEEQLATLVRAFEVPCLIGAKFCVRTLESVSAALRELLAATIPGFGWESVEVSEAPIRKYLLLHTSVSAPQDLTTGEPMALEVYGRIIRAGDMSQSEAESWPDVWMTKREKARLEGPVEFQICQATYANIAFPGIGVPFYT
jgi:hypothetical protein